jgi:hypothetical protein
VARGTQLQTLAEMLQDECRLSSATSRGVDHRTYLQRLIKRVQEELYDDFDWPFMKIKRDEADKTLAAGQRYYDFPTALNPERITTVHVNNGGIWTPLVRGIGTREYSAMDSDSDVRSDPALHWDWYGEDQFEVWPMPAANGDTVRFDGRKKLTALSQESATADLDDILIVLFCAAEVLAPNNQKDAEVKLQKAQRRLAVLGMNNMRSAGPMRFGGGARDGGRRETTLRVARVAS